MILFIHSCFYSKNIYLLCCFHLGLLSTNDIFKQRHFFLENVVNTMQNIKKKRKPISVNLFFELDTS